jgi:hypothetical protein
MIKKRQLIFTCLSLIICIGVGYSYTRLIERFDERNIHSDLPHDPRWETRPLEPEGQREVAEILNQNFYYLSKGCQVYAFVSEDRRYVLKFFKCQHLNTRWVEYLPALPYLSDYQKNIQTKRLQKAMDLFTGYKIGFEDLPKETGILYMHLNKSSHLKQKVMIYNKLGVGYTVNLDDIAFVLQEKAQSLYATIDHYMDSNDSESVEQLLTNLASVLKMRNEKGIWDKDLQLVYNIGIVDGEVRFIDPGQFVKNDHLMDAEANERDVQLRFRDLRVWLSKHYPELKLSSL